MTPGPKVHNEMHLIGPEMECIRTAGPVPSTSGVLELRDDKVPLPLGNMSLAFAIESGRIRSSFGGDV